MVCGHCGSDALAVIELLTREVAVVATDRSYVRDPRISVLNDDGALPTVGFKCWSCGYQAPTLMALSRKPEALAAIA